MLWVGRGREEGSGAFIGGLRQGHSGSRPGADEGTRVPLRLVEATGLNQHVLCYTPAGGVGGLQRPPLAPSSACLCCLPVGPHHLRAQPSAPCDLPHSGKEMEVIHSGNCDCPFPGKGCSREVPVAFPQGGPRPLPLSPQGVPGRVGLGRERVRCARPPARPSGSALHLPPRPGARELCGSPPSALCYSPTSCLWSPTRAHFPGREAAEGREFLGDTPTGSRLLPPPDPPPPARQPAPGGSRGPRESPAGVTAGWQGGHRTPEGAARPPRLRSRWRD